MTGWSDRWDAPAEPSWVIEPTSEWHPQFPGQRYPGDLGSQYADPRGRVTASGRAEVPPLAPTRSDGTYLGRSWSDLDDGPPRRDDPRDERHGDHDPYRRLADETYRAPTDETYRAPTDEAYRRPSDEPIWQRERRQPAPGRHDDRPDVDRRTDRVSWSDRRRGGGEPAPTGWHRDRADTDRYDSPPRQERSAPGITPVSPGRPPVSPAPRHEPPRDRPDRFTEPDWRREPDEGPPRRRTTSERPTAAPGHRVDDEPHHRAADRYDPYPAGPARGGDLPTRFREDDPPRRDTDRRPAAHGHPDRWQRPLHDEPPVRPRDDTPPGPPPRHDGRSTTPAIPEERWQHPRGHDERRPAQPYEPAARHVAYPDLRPQDEPYREPWGRTGTGPRPAREPDHGRDGRPAYPPRHPAEPPTRHEDRPAAWTGPGQPGDRRPGAAPGRPGVGTPPLDPPSGRPVSGAPVSGLPVSPAPVSSPPGSTAAGPPATGPWGPRPGPPPPPAGTRPGGSDAPAPAAGRRTPLPPDAPASPAELPTRKRHAAGRPPVPAPDQPTPVSAPPAARLHIEFRRPPESTPPVDRPTGRPPVAPATGTDRPTEPGTGGRPPAAPATDRPALEITPDRPRRYVPPAPVTGGTDRPGSATRPPSEGSAAWFRPGRSTPTPATPTDRTTADGTAPDPATAGRPAAPDGTPTGGAEVPVPRSPAPPSHPTDPGPVPSGTTGDPGRSTIPAGDPADPGGRPAVAAGAEPHTVDGPADVGAAAGPPRAGRSVPATPDALLDAPDPFGATLGTAGSGPPATPDPVTPPDVPAGTSPQNRSDTVDADAGPTQRFTPVAPTGTDPAGDHAVPAAVPDRTVPVSPAPVTGSTVTDLPGTARPDTGLPESALADIGLPGSALPGGARPGTATAPPAGTATAGAGPVGTAVGRDDPARTGPAGTRPTDPGPAGTTTEDDGAARTDPGDTASTGTGPAGTGTGDDEPSRTTPTRTEPDGTGPASALTDGTGPGSAVTDGTGPGSTLTDGTVTDGTGTGGGGTGGGGPAATVTVGEQHGPPSPDRTVPVDPRATADRAAPPDRPTATAPVATEDRAGTTDRPAGTDRTAAPDRAEPDDRATIPDRPAGTDRPADTDPQTDTDRARTTQRGATGDRVTEDRAAAAGPTVGVPAAPGDAATAARPTDPEQVLAGYRWRLDPETLREVVDDPAELRIVRRRLTEKLASALDNRARARLLSLRAVLSRLVDDLDDAVADGRLALTYAEATGELRRTALARARLAEALRWKGEFAEADRLFTEANSTELPDRLRSALHEHAGRSCYDQGRLIEACGHFERALDLYRAEDAELTDRIAVCLDAVHARAAGRGGFGPYPRSRDEVRHGRRSPRPTHDGQGRWGYADTDGELVVDYRYVEAQPFHERMAWVRRPDQAGWELIDETGGVLLGPAYARVLAFSDGLAWVSQGGDADWSAIEPDGTVVVPAGFEEVRPFRAGVAAVRRGGWGAVDRHGRLVVPPRYHGIDTTLSDGRRLDGFTDEGLAVVELAGRRGVLDRTGTVLVRPVHPALVVHPVAFLVGDGMNHWGALDRRGEPLIPPVHPDWDTVVSEIDRLLADTHPVL